MSTLVRISAAYFSPTGNARKLCLAMASALCESMGLTSLRPTYLDLTSAAARREHYTFGPGELLLLALPVYAGRLPNKIVPDLKTCFYANGAWAIPMVTYGNRDFGDALSELCLLLREAGFHLPAAAALVGEHAFSPKLAYGRPDSLDLSELKAFAKAVTPIFSQENFSDVVPSGNTPPGPYYTPLQEDGSPANFLKAKPQTDPELCTGCGLCADLCPMESISREDPSETKGICIKCMACVRNCPTGAKSFTDEAFLSHVRMLEKNFSQRTANRFFLAERSAEAMA